MAIVVKENESKKVFQVNIAPSKVERSMDAARAWIVELRGHARVLAEKKSSGYRTVVLVDGRSGESPDNAILTYLAKEFVSMEELLDVVDNILVANADLATSMLLKVCSNFPSFEKMKNKVVVI